MSQMLSMSQDLKQKRAEENSRNNMMQVNEAQGWESAKGLYVDHLAKYHVKKITDPVDLKKYKEYVWKNMDIVYEGSNVELQPFCKSTDLSNYIVYGTRDGYAIRHNWRFLINKTTKMVKIITEDELVRYNGNADMPLENFLDFPVFVVYDKIYYPTSSWISPVYTADNKWSLDYAKRRDGINPKDITIITFRQLFPAFSKPEHYSFIHEKKLSYNQMHSNLKYIDYDLKK